MSEFARVEFNDKTAGEIEPEEKPEETSGDEPTGEEKPEEQTEETPERPEWLDERFKTPEDLAKSYAELEAKLRERQEKKESEANPDPNTEKETPETSGNVMELVNDASKEFWENDGKMSDETYAKLEQSGFSRELVDSFAKGQAALQSQFTTNVQSAANGEFEQMEKWAEANASDVDKATYLEAINSGNENLARMAVESMYSRYKGANPSQPNLVTGETSGNAGVKPFASRHELTAAIGDPRYKAGDKAYHKEIDRRLAISKDL